jgi:DNA-binding transcriptional MerR regulator
MYTIKRVSEMVGVPVATLRAWQRRYGVVNPGRSNSGYRLYGTGDIAVLRRMQALVASGWSPKEAAAAVSGEADFETDPRNVRRIELPARAAALPTSTAVEDLVTAAIDLDPLAAGRLLDEHFATGSFEHAVDAWLLPELERLGAAWANGDVTVAGEHIVAAAVQRRLSAAFDAAATDSERFPLLLTGLPAGCHHELGILAYATAARRRGMAVVHLGPDLPVRDWFVAVQRHQPDAVVIAVPTVADIQSAAELIKGLAARHVLIAVGGRYQDDTVSAANVSDDQWVIGLGHSMGGGAAKLRERLEPPRS